MLEYAIWAERWRISSKRGYFGAMKDGSLVYLWRKAMGLAQSTAAKETGVGHRTWVRWESGADVSHERKGECFWRRLLELLVSSEADLEKGEWRYVVGVRRRTSFRNGPPDRHV